MTARKHSDRLKKIADRTPQQVARALYMAGQLIENDAEHSITQGSISGAGHIPAAAGTAPNADTRFLDTNIETEIGGPGIVTVTSKAPYSAALEYGFTRNGKYYGPWPFMRPAVERNRKKVAQLVGDAVSVTVRR